MISLTKGGTISLTKSSNNGLKSVCVGLNWGKIKNQSSGFFSKMLGGDSMIDVDLDASVICYDANKNVIETVYFGNLKSRDNSIKHSGDDRGGDDSKDDNDNEVIQMNLGTINPQVKYIACVLHSFKNQDFNTIPYSTIRVYEGQPNQPKQILGVYSLSSEPKFAGKVAMILGVLIKENNEWNFKAIGEPLDDKKLAETEATLKRSNFF